MEMSYTVASSLADTFPNGTSWAWISASTSTVGTIMGSFSCRSSSAIRLRSSASFSSSALIENPTAALIAAF